jgi:hypothetical protein
MKSTFQFVLKLVNSYKVCNEVTFYFVMIKDLGQVIDRLRSLVLYVRLVVCNGIISIEVSTIGCNSLEQSQ